MTTVTTAPPVEIDRRLVLRVGAVSAILGSVLALAANVLQPDTAAAHIEEVVFKITQAGSWSSVHLVLSVGLILIVAALAALTASLEREPSRSVARFALLAALLGGALLLVSTAIEGFAVNQLARAWQLAPLEERAAALRITAAVIAVQWAINSLAWIVLLGIGMLLYGLATTLSGAYPKPLGWLAIVLGVGGFAVGVIQAFGGPGAGGTDLVTALLSALVVVWIFVLGLLMWRKAQA
jgi:hypothetical protein